MGADSRHLFEEELQTLTDNINRVNTTHETKKQQTISIVLSDSMRQKRSLMDMFIQLFQ